jgi:hypothetical protein
MPPITWAIHPRAQLTCNSTRTCNSRRTCDSRRHYLTFSRNSLAKSRFRTGECASQSPQGHSRGLCILVHAEWGHCTVQKVGSFKVSWKKADIEPIPSIPGPHCSEGRMFENAQPSAMSSGRMPSAFPVACPSVAGYCGGRVAGIFNIVY